MKKTTLLLCLLAALALPALCLSGCKRSDIAPNFTGVIADWRPSTSRAGNTEPSEIVPLDSPAFGEYTGFDVTAWPDGDSLTPEQFFAVDGWFGQIEYRTDDDRLLVVRVAEDGPTHLTSTYYERHTAGDPLEVDGIEVARWNSTDGCDMATWTRDGFQYLVHSNTQQGALKDADIEALVRGLASEKTAGAASAAVSTSGGE